MSSSAEPISAERFSLAIADLPLSNVYSKAAEIRNSLAHLAHSNEQLRPDAEQGDKDCADAIQENLHVIERMEIRLQLLKHEVERRGYNWDEAKPTTVVSGDPMDVDNSDMADDQTQQVSNQSYVSQNGLQPPTNSRDATNNLRQTRNQEEGDMLALLQARLRDDDEHGLHL